MVKMKPSGVDWVGVIPSNWSLKKIRFVTRIRTEVGKYTPDDIFIGLENVESSTGRLVETESEYEEGTYDVFRKGDVLFSKLRPYLEKAFVADFDGFCTGEFVVFKGFEGDKRFLFYFLLSHGFIEIVNASTYGAKMPRASWNYIKNLNMPLPCVTEQRAIAKFLDDRCAQVDAIIADITRQVEILQKYKKALITETVTKGLDKSVAMKYSGIKWIGEMPAHWGIAYGKAIFKIYGGSISDDEMSFTEIDKWCEVLYFKVDDMNATETGFEMIYDKEPIYTPRKNKPFKAHLILVPKRGGAIYTNKVRITNRDCCIDPNIMAISVLGNISYFAYLIWGRSLADIGDVSTIPQINNKHINYMKVTIPPQDEQAAIVEYLDGKCAETEAIIDEKQRSVEVMRQYKKSLIYEYVTGKKRVTMLP